MRVEATSRASAETVYAVLADLSTHTVWAGERQGKRTRLLTIDAPAGPAVVGTEFSSTGSDPMGSFSDRSVVTEATTGEDVRVRHGGAAHDEEGDDQRLDERRAVRARADGRRLPDRLHGPRDADQRAARDARACSTSPASARSG